MYNATNYFTNKYFNLVLVSLLLLKQGYIIRSVKKDLSHDFSFYVYLTKKNLKSITSIKLVKQICYVGPTCSVSSNIILWAEPPWFTSGCYCIFTTITAGNAAWQSWYKKVVLITTFINSYLLLQVP